MARFVYCSSEEHYKRKMGLGSSRAKAGGNKGPALNYSGPGLYHNQTGERMEVPDRGGELCAPIVMADTPEHVAPDGSLITSRSHRDELCKRKGWSPYERLTSRPTGLANRKYAKKVGMEVSEEAREYLKDRKKKAFKKARLTSDGTPMELAK